MFEYYFSNFLLEKFENKTDNYGSQLKIPNISVKTTFYPHWYVRMYNEGLCVDLLLLFLGRTH
jgi:hypothetical protein